MDRNTKYHTIHDLVDSIKDTFVNSTKFSIEYASSADGTIHLKSQDNTNDIGTDAMFVYQHRYNNNNESKNNTPQNYPIVFEQQKEQLIPEQMSRKKKINQFGSSIYEQRKMFQQNFSKVWGSNTSKSEFLGSMFADPSYKFRGTLESAKTKAQTENKWIFVNLQDTENFVSHCLNRDLWKDELEFGEVIQDTVVFYQWTIKSDHGRRLINLYKCKKFPCVFVIDPVTGRKEQEFDVPNDPHKVESMKVKILTWLDDHLKPKLTSTKCTVENQNNEQQNDRSQIFVDPEPSADYKNSTIIRVRMPNGSIMQRRFKKDAKIQKIYNWIECSSTDNKKVSLVQTMPLLKLNDFKQKTLKQMGLISTTLSCN
eukprot:298882_1